MGDDEPLARSDPVLEGSRLLDRVQQLADGDRGWAARVRALVAARVGDQQPFAGGHQRIEQELAVLGARVALTDPRVIEQQVVAVTRSLARERVVVEPEQADDPMRYRAHRLERADGQMAG